MQVHPADVYTVAKDAAQSLSCAFDRSINGNVNEWIGRCKQDLAQLWTNGTLWMVSEVHQTTGGLVLNIVACSGVYDDGSILREIEDWAREVGCIKVLFTGRKGWARRILDYKVTTVTMEKGL